ncbi:uncharacterized protein LOC129775541 [Toxorhynchites rutilus septentrionalis]|uniref:uncharacterized protein LOC129775541 n=1 Tax=Toxorhynchites rutilus septentrionalis TaxID=329112 RepID=UPI002479E66B|nr:uncharacterized protein LOC129775541 [Toxorhynchites rutilus septentrionalis]
MQTPLYKFHPEDYDVVYDPAEDSFLLLDALESELECIKRAKPLVCVEIGPGSGIIITALAKALGYGNSHFVGVDINPHACRMTKRTSELNSCHMDVVNMDLLGSFASGAVDLLIFNPPYVATSAGGELLEEQIDQFARDRHELVKSWAGGFDGMAITNKVLEDLDRILAPGALFYLLLSAENKPQEVMKGLSRRQFDCEIIIDRKIRGEHLYVLKIRRKRPK